MLFEVEVLKVLVLAAAAVDFVHRSDHSLLSPPPSAVLFHFLAHFALIDCIFRPFQHFLPH